MRAQDLTDKWVAKKLKWEDICVYLSENIIGATESLTYNELAHIAQCCHHLYELHMGIRPCVGDFLTAFIKNDLWKACMLADNVNRKALWVYVQFMYNVAPGLWRRTLKGKL